MSDHDFLLKNLRHKFEINEKKFSKKNQIKTAGVLVKITGLILEAEGCQVAVGSSCTVINRKGRILKTEVVGFDGNRIFLMSTEPVNGYAPGDAVKPVGTISKIPMSDAYLGRIIDGEGQPLDNGPEIMATTYYPLLAKPRNPLDREKISEVLDVGVKSINALNTIGKGQRIGLFAGSGVGKSVLLGMLTKFTKADVIVVGLIGERGREVKEFIEETLGPEALTKAVIVASPADTSPLMRIHAAHLATTLSEYFRDQGRSVLLLMDSLTRYSQAQREIALAIGEPPVSKGYPPSVFAQLPKLVERAGNGADGEGSISAIYTVLSEGDDNQDPIVDAARAILDGHIVLSRRLAESGHYPAIDITGSISRVMVNITSEIHLKLYKKFFSLYAHYQENRDLIAIGAYVMGSDPKLDFVIKSTAQIEDFLQQSMGEPYCFEDSLKILENLLKDAP